MRKGRGGGKLRMKWHAGRIGKWTAQDESWVHHYQPESNHFGGKYFVDVKEVETEVRKWLRQKSKNFYPAGFDALVKRWVKCIIVGGGYVEKYMFLQDRISHVLCFTPICDLFTDTTLYK
jgi:hypothetical protein